MITSPNVIILAYNAYSCGKFIGNILSYNKNFVPQFPFDGNRGAWYSKEYYDSLSVNELHSIKHKTVMLTVPDIRNTTDWLDYELGCAGFWGKYSTTPYSISRISQKIIELLEQNVNCFLVAHDPIDLSNKKKSFPNSTVIRIVNDYRINSLSRQLKMKTPEPLVDGFVDFKCDSCLEFDIDCLFDQELFFSNITDLLNKLDLDDCSLDPRVYEYYQKYCNLYSNIL